jgi:hypothetical protein
LLSELKVEPIGSLAGLALGNLEDTVHLYTLKHISAATDPANFNAVDPFPLAQAEMWIHPIMALVPATAVDLVQDG